MKKCILLLTAALLLMSIAAAAEPPYVAAALETASIVYTEREEIPTPRGSIYLQDKYGVVDADGTYIVEPIYQEISVPQSGRARFKINGCYGYFDENWQVAIEPLYRGALDFSEGLAAVANENWLWGYIDAMGQEVIQCKYNHAQAFENGVATVAQYEEGYFGQTFHKQGQIDKNGNVLAPLSYAHQEAFAVLLSQNDVVINGTVYQNSSLAYPFINYLGYSYIPLTYHGCRALGIHCDYSEAGGLVLTPGGNLSGEITGEQPMQPGVYAAATLYRGTITINGTVYKSEDIYYPLLSYRDVVYLPVLWRQGMEALGIEYSYALYETPTAVAAGQMIFNCSGE